MAVKKTISNKRKEIVPPWERGDTGGPRVIKLNKNTPNKKKKGK